MAIKKSNIRILTEKTDYSTIILATASSEEDLNSFIDGYMIEFDPEEFKTNVRSKSQRDEESWSAIIHRFNDNLNKE